MTLKMVVFAPMPIARVNNAAIVTPGLLAMARAALRRSSSTLMVPVLPRDERASQT